MDSITRSDESFEQVLKNIAMKTPAPGGGAVAAAAGALSAAMGEMVLAWSLGRKATAAHEPALRDALDGFALRRAELLRWFVEDQRAYLDYTAARKLPEADAARGAHLARALADCVAVPMAVARAAQAVIASAHDVADRVSPYLLSDLGVCVELARATVSAAGWNVRANLADMDDEGRQSAWDEFCVIERDSETTAGRAIDRIVARMSANV
jgi:formiminotetrahydrofolate cyclodeaminase